MEIKHDQDRTLCVLVRGDPVQEVLLGYKKVGFGAGKYTGFGGKVEAGESVAQAAARELLEETCIRVNVQDLSSVGHLYFNFPARPEWSMVAHVFTAARWEGEAVESREMIPEWFTIDEIPYEKMWSDGAYWLPPVIRGERIRACFTFNSDNETLNHIEYEPWVEKRNW